jgi:hypothetical protein
MKEAKEKRKKRSIMKSTRRRLADALGVRGMYTASW